MPETTRSPWDDEIRTRLAAARLEPTSELEIARELAQHLDDRYADLRASGLDADDARRQALADLDGDEVMRRELARVRRGESTIVPAGAPTRGSWLADVWQDARYAARVLMANRGFTAMAMLTLALGVGATTAIFSVVKSVLLTPLPYDPNGSLVRVLLTSTAPGQAGAPPRLRRMSPSLPAIRQLRERNEVLDDVGAWIGIPLTLLEDGSAERVTSIEVTPGFFEAINTRTIAGRLFTDADLVEPVAIISHGYWQRKYGGDPAALGRTIRTLNGDRTIVGVLPPDFSFIRSDFWLPISELPIRGQAGWGGNLIGRLKPGVGVQPAQESLGRLVAQLEAEGIWTKDAGVQVASLHAWNVQTARPTILMLFGATGFILLLACVNVSGLLVARGAERARELGIRTALGAHRPRLIRQLLTESVLLSVCGGLAGTFLAWLSLSVLISTLPLSIPAGMQPAIDGRVLAFAFLVSIVSGCLFGLLPAFRLTRAGAAVVKGGGAGAAVTSRRFAGGMVLVQAALAVMLLVGASLMVRSLQRLLAVELGFQPDGVLTVAVQPVLVGEEQQARRAHFYREVIDRISALPSVMAVGAIDTLPYHSVSYSSVEVEGSAQPADVSPRVVTPGYFEAMDIPVKAGRSLRWDDRADAPCVVVVNEQAAKTLWNTSSPLGRRLRRNATSPWCEVVGVAQDTRHFSRESPVLLEIYFASLQSPPTDLTMVARTTQVEPLPSLVRARLTGLPEPALAPGITPMTRLVNQSAEQRRQRAQLLTALGGLGVLLACVGIFGLTAYAVARRTQEIGLRIALGATTLRVLQSVMAGFVPAIIGGVVVGLFGAWAASRTFESYLFGVTATDPATLTTVALLFITIALLACYLPARRALKVDPVVALRSE